MQKGTNISSIFGSFFSIFIIHLFRTIVHELGHIIISLIFNWQIYEVNLSLNPFVKNYCLINGLTYWLRSVANHSY